MSAVKTTTLSNLDGSKSISVDTVVQGTAKAWVNFNGTGTVAIRASGNVSSITDNGVGNYTVNFTTAMPDVNYSISSNHTGESTASGETIGSYTTTGVLLYTGNNNVSYDPSSVFLAVFR